MNDRTKASTLGGLAVVVALAAGIALGLAWGDGDDMDDTMDMQGMGDMQGPDDTSATTDMPDSGDMSSMDGMQDMGGAQDMGGMAMDGTIRLTAGEVATFGITYGKAEVRPLTRTVRTVGMVDFDETRMAYVAPKFGGWVERLHADFIGQRVRRGQPLVDVYSPELVTAQEELLLATRMAEGVGDSRVEDVADGARDLVASARRRLAYWDISEEQIERLLETGEVSKTLTLYAPVTGIVMQKDAFEGRAFESGSDLYMIADLSRVWVNAEIFEADADLIRDGMGAEIGIDALPGRPLSGRVEYVYPTLEDRTRSMRARIALDNPDGTLKPGMYATVRLAARHPEALTVPASAVLHTGVRAVVFVDVGGGELMPHEVVVGTRGEEYVEVLSGVEDGQRVVTSAQFLLDSESNLAEVMMAMMAQMNPSDMEGMDMGGMDMGGMDMSDDPMSMDSTGAGDTLRPDSTGGR